MGEAGASGTTVTVRGHWPGAITLRRGWSRAEARPWNEASRDASLRLVRGGAGFLAGCRDTLLGFGAAAVVSPPLPESAQRSWRSAGFEPFVDLSLLRLDLTAPVPAPNHLVVRADLEHLDALVDIDQAAFDEFWRFDRLGLMEAMEATDRAELYVIRGGTGTPVAFAIIGLGQAICYLQRVAVHPEWQRHGMGRSMIRAVARRARSSGSRAVLLNTQPENEAAIRLYLDEGYRVMPRGLQLLRATA